METPRIRARGQIAPMIVITIVVGFTIVSAAANLIPTHRPTAAQIHADEMAAVSDARRERISELRGTQCQPAQAHELVRLLAFDGRWDELHAFGDLYEERCGADSIVRGWAAARRRR